MTLTLDCWESTEAHSLGGWIARYRFGPRFALSLIGTPMAHSYPFAWEAAVVVDGCLHYGTPLTSDVEVFETEEETNAFIAKAKAYFATEEAAALPGNSNANRERRERMAELAEEIRDEKNG